jgi:hypothetical protein
MATMTERADRVTQARHERQASATAAAHRLADALHTADHRRPGRQVAGGASATAGLAAAGAGCWLLVPLLASWRARSSLTGGCAAPKLNLRRRL